MEATDLTAGAAGAARLVLDDRDRHDLLESVRAALGHSLLAYCVMGTHLHAIAEAPPEHARRWFEEGVRAYIRTHRRRHGSAPALRARPRTLLRTPAYLAEFGVRPHPVSERGLLV
jgi:hypothetical protein